MNKIISIKQKFLCKDCEYILEISRLKVKKAKQYGGVYCCQGPSKNVGFGSLKM